MAIMRGYREILSLSWPILLEMGVQMLIMNVNMFMVSRLGDRTVAAVATANTALSLVGLLLGIVGIGANILVAQYVGAKDKASTSQIVMESIRLNLLVSIVVALAMFSVPWLILALLHTPSSILGPTRVYLRLMSLLLPIQSLSMMAAGILRSFGSTRSVLYLSLFNVLLTVLGNAIVVFQWFGMPALGIVGLVGANAIGGGVSTALLCWILYRQVPLRTRISAWWKRGRFTWDVIRVGIPSAVELGSYQLTQFLIVSLVSLLGAYAVATRAYASTVESMSFLVGMGLSQGVSILVGHHVGRSDYKGARVIAGRGIVLGTTLMTLTGVLLFVFGGDVIRLFSHDDAVIAWGTGVLRIIAVAQPAKAVNMVIGGALRGAGDNKWLMWNSGTFVWLSIIFAYLFGVTWQGGLYGMWWGMCLDEWIRAALVLRRLLSNRWQGRSYVVQHVESVQQ
jgi:putative MATE family efflux protein